MSGADVTYHEPIAEVIASDKHGAVVRTVLRVSSPQPPPAAPASLISQESALPMKCALRPGLCQIAILVKGPNGHPLAALGAGSEPSERTRSSRAERGEGSTAHNWEHVASVCRRSFAFAVLRTARLRMTVAALREDRNLTEPYPSPHIP